MENIKNKTWDDFKKESNKELKEKDAPYRLVSSWFLILSWLAIIVLMAFFISIPILAYNGKFQSIDNSSIVLNNTNNVNVEKTEVPVNIDDRDINNFNPYNNFTIINNIYLNNTCNCT